MLDSIRVAALLRRDLRRLGNLRQRVLNVQHILQRVVVHIAHQADVEERLNDRHLLRCQHVGGLIACPRKVVAVVVKRVVGILRGIEAAMFPVAHPRIDPGDDLTGNAFALRLAKALVRVHVIPQQLRVVVAHLLEVRHDPALIHRVAMKPAGQMIVEATLRHLLERHHRRQPRGRIGTVAPCGIEQQIERAGMRKLGLRAEPAIAPVELLQHRVDDLADQFRTGILRAAVEAFVVFDRGHDAACGVVDLVAPVLERLGHRVQHAAKAGASVPVDRREVGAAEERRSGRGEEGRQRPSALSADGGDCGLVARVDVGPLVAIDLDGDVVLVDQRRGVGVFIALAVHDVTPVAPHGADVEQDRLVFGRGARKGVRTPLVPVDGLVHGRAQVCRACRRQTVEWGVRGGVVCHPTSLRRQGLLDGQGDDCGVRGAAAAGRDNHVVDAGRRRVR